MITHSRLLEVRKKLFGRKLAKRPKPPNEAERLYLGAMRGWAAEFKTIVMGSIVRTYPELAELAAKHDGFDPDEPGGSYRRADGTRLDALRIGPLMLGKRASKVLQGITNPLREAADRVPLGQIGGTVRAHVEHDVPRYMPGLKNTDLFLGSELAAWRGENVDLITNLSDEMLDRIGDLLEDYDGTRVEEIASALEDTFGVTRARAELIARDQTLKLNGRMNQAAQTAAGVDRYRWSTSNDGSVRNDPKDRGDPNHEILNNTIHSWDDPPVTCERTGATNHPGQDFQCRCIAVPLLEEFDEPAQTEAENTDGGWDETVHPREPAGSPNGGEFAGGASITRESLEPRLRGLQSPESGWSKASAKDSKIRAEQIQNFNNNAGPEEKGSIQAFVDQDYALIRAAERSQEQGTMHAKDAMLINQAIARDGTKATTLFRGESLTPAEAHVLLEAKSVKLGAISSFSAKVSEAQAFAAGKSFGEGTQDESRIPVIYYGKIKGLALEGRFFGEEESLVAARTLKIESVSSVVHPKYGTTLVVKVR